MRRRKPRRRIDQRDLLPAPAMLQWNDLPAAVRARTVELLAQLLRLHASVPHATEAPNE